MPDKVLAIAVHPDDETLGCGGTLLHHASRGDSIHWLIATSMDPADGYTADKITSRASEIEKVAEFYGFADLVELEIPTTRVDERSKGELVLKMKQALERVQPEVVYMPFPGDVHSDHRCVSEAVWSCTKWFRSPYLREVYMMEILSETEFSQTSTSRGFTPNTWVDISTHLEKKLEAMRIYESELTHMPFPRSEEAIRALATYRGVAAGFSAAEAFVLAKKRVS